MEITFKTRLAGVDRSALTPMVRQALTMERLPRTFCHHDAFRHNLRLQPQTDGDGPLVAFD